MTASGKAVFLSYASEDAGAAKGICDAFRDAGIEVWFDQTELRGGDAWDQKIRQQIRDCALFIPIISAHTQARPEGYFRLEWKLAVDRTHLMAAEKAFLVPVVVDATTEPNALVPTPFREVQWIRIQTSEVPAAFVKRISALLDQPVASHASSPQGSATRSPSRRPHVVFISLAAAAAAALVISTAMRGGWLWQKPAPTLDASIASTSAATPPAIPDKSVAVLPFLDMSEKHDQEYFSDGLSEELLNLLTKVSDLRVAARTSAFSFKGKSEDIPTIARKLLVAHVLEGSIRKSGKHVRITAQLIRADNGYHLWSETYDREIDDIFKVQDEIAGAVVRALKVALTESTAPKASPAANSEAYNWYLRAMSLRHGLRNREAAATIVDDLHNAIQADSTYAPAWAELSRALLYQSNREFVPVAAITVEAHDAAARSIALDPLLASANVAMGAVSEFVDWDWLAAERAYRRAEELNPGGADVQDFLAGIEMALGHIAESRSHTKRSIELDPLDERYHFYLGMADYFQGDYSGAEAELQTTGKLNPEFDEIYAAVARVRVAVGDLNGALSAARLEPSEGHRGAALAIAYSALGRKAESDSTLRELEARHAGDLPALIAGVHAYRGEIDDAFRWLDRAYKERDLDLEMFQVDPYFQKLRGDPRWKALLRQLKLPA